MSAATKTLKDKIEEKLRFRPCGVCKWRCAPGVRYECKTRFSNISNWYKVATSYPTVAISAPSIVRCDKWQAVTRWRAGAVNVPGNNFHECANDKTIAFGRNDFYIVTFLYALLVGRYSEQVSTFWSFHQYVFYHIRTRRS